MLVTILHIIAHRKPRLTIFLHHGQQNCPADGTTENEGRWGELPNADRWQSVVF
ncbi:hypothetical protein NON20_23430 [Synechocystis sp. B12]|nr:hypothetical protein NON20_23430 [Synechocystis sp. B12]